MRIRYEVYDFVNFKVEEREREINSDDVLKDNALFQKLVRNAKKKDAAK